MTGHIITLGFFGSQGGVFIPTLGFTPAGAAAIRGPFLVDAAEVYAAGAAEAQPYVAGAAEAEPFVAGAVAAETSAWADGE